MKVADIMTQEVISVSPETLVTEAASIMLREHISGLPVINCERVLVGMVTEGDLLRRVESGTEKERPRWLELLLGPTRLADAYVRSHGRRVADVMSTNLAVVTEEMTIAHAIDVMEKFRVKRLPVVRGGKVVGIIARANLLQTLTAYLPTIQSRADDELICAQVRAELKRQSWNARFANIVVRDGVVDVWGFIANERHRDAIRVAVEGVPGVKKVRDHLRWVDALTGSVLSVGTVSGSPLSVERGLSNR